MINKIVLLFQMHDYIANNCFSLQVKITYVCYNDRQIALFIYAFEINVFVHHWTFLFNLVYILRIIIPYTYWNNYKIYLLKPSCTVSIHFRFSFIHKLLLKIYYMPPGVLKYNDETRWTLFSQNVVVCWPWWYYPIQSSMCYDKLC